VLTLAAAADGVLEARGSRFLARVVPIPGDGDECADLKARRALAPTIAAHPKATHHVTAWRALDTGGRIEEHARDDGEPAGTAGRPALRVLQGAELINVATVVVRYYGGVKLGTGGLARAYAGAVRDALEGTELIRWVATASARVFSSFASMSALERAVGEHGLRVDARRYVADGAWLHLQGDAAALGTLAEYFEFEWVDGEPD
jgi:putative IMPACT (imprinted ancient) family translation regulator